MLSKAETTAACRYPIGSDERASYIEGYEEVQRKLVASNLRYQRRMTWECSKNYLLVALIIHEICLLVTH